MAFDDCVTRLMFPHVKILTSTPAGGVKEEVGDSQWRQNTNYLSSC